MNTRSIIQEAVENNDHELAKKALVEIESRLKDVCEEEERIYLLFSRANCHVVLGNFDDARKSLDIALTARPDESGKTNFDWMQAVIDQRQGNYSNALQKFAALMRNHASTLRQSEWRFLYEDIQCRRAFLTVSLGEFRDALAFLNECLTFDLCETVRSELHARVGACYVELEDFQTARTHLRQAIEHDLSGDWKWKIHYYLGIANYYSGMLEDSKREFKKCEELATTNSIPILDVYGWLAVVCKASGATAEWARYTALRKRN